MKKRLNIKEIKVNSFVTDLPEGLTDTVKSGLFSNYCRATGYGWQYCPTNACTGVNCGSANPC